MESEKNITPSGTYFETGERSSYGTPMKVWIANADSWEDTRTYRGPVYVFQFGAYGDVWVAALTSPGMMSLESVMPEVADWITENIPGMTTTPDYPEDIEDADEDDEGEAIRMMEEAEVDLTDFSCGGGDAVWIPSWEWTVTECVADSKIWKMAVDAAEKAGEEC